MRNKKVILKGIKSSALKKKLGNKCVYCGCTNPMIMQIDHKHPVSRNGEDKDSNKQVACAICNQLKDKLTHVQFKKYYKNLISMYDLQKISLYIADPIVTFHVKGYTPTKEEVEEEIRAEELLKENDALEKEGEQ